MTNKEQAEALDAMIGATLSSVPTHQENEDHLAAIEGSMTAELEDEVFEGWISREEAEVVLRAFHQRLHPMSTSGPIPASDTLDTFPSPPPIGDPEVIG